LLHSTLAKRVCLLLLLLIAFYFYGLGHFPFVGPDEPRYSQVAREMLQSRDLITPTLGGHTWFEKPVLLYWLIALSFSLFGVTEAAARFAPALSGVLTVLAVFWLGRRIERASIGSQSIACTSALMLVSMPGIIVFARGASFDILVTMTLTWALVMFLAAQLEHDETKRRKLYASFYCFIGLSLLAKGLVGIVIPFGVVSLFYLMRWSLPARDFFVSLLWGLPLAIAVSAIWYGPVLALHGWPFVNEFFLQHHFARYVSNKYHHPQPVYYYLLIIFPMALPWLVLAIAALWRIRRSTFRGNSIPDVVLVFALAWFLAPLILFSFSGSKLPGYLLPVLPALALLAATRLKMSEGAESLTATPGTRASPPASMRIAAPPGARASPPASMGIAAPPGTRASSPASMRIVGAFLIAIAAAGVVYARSSGTLSVTCAVFIVLPLLIAGILAASTPRRIQGVTFSVAAAVPLSFFLALHCDIPQLIEERSARPLLERAAMQGFAEAPLYFLHEVDRGTEFYAAGRIPYDQNGQPIKFEGAYQVLDEAQRLQKTVLVIVPVIHVFQLENLERAAVERITDNGELAIVAVRPKDY